ncbi:hypothetical protein [Azospirillum rugosum]|uniref:Uncharacterized protein n=1 Tax=Azospirillum rugosum TaxID=416170 RepID=A0ABS4SE56_9PROT|nr:hypothetical protein [Azospirillum rugosum]MBP2290866.1 hypothetical protein [Azospirillum rugosum]MDQ0529733.1 hypothetical protein [Azospirillum rugosum]
MNNDASSEDIKSLDLLLSGIKAGIEHDLYSHRKARESYWNSISRLLLKIEAADISLRYGFMFPISEDGYSPLREIEERFSDIFCDEFFVEFAGKCRFYGSRPLSKKEFIKLRNFEGARLSTVLDASKVCMKIIVRLLTVESQVHDENNLKNLRRMLPPQKIAPVQFDFQSGRLVLLRTRNSFESDDYNNIASAKEAIVAQGERIQEYLKQSNCDRRLIETFSILQEQLTLDDNIIKLALTNITCDIMRSACEPELSESVNSMILSHTRSIEMFAAQFPDWRRFVEHAAIVSIDQADINRISEATNNLIKDLASRHDYVDPEIPNTFSQLNELLRAPSSAGKRAAFAVLRSIENLISKVFSLGADFFDQTAQKTVDGLSTAVSKAIIVGLLTAALGGAAQVTPVAAKINEMTWLKNAAELVQKQIDRMLME